MDNTKTKRRRPRRPTNRRLIQLYSALLYNAHLRGFVDGRIYQGAAKYACVPGLNCYSCPGAVGSCPLGALQNALAASGHRAGWYVLGILLLFGTLLGRTVCGWLCPIGLAQELLHKIPSFKLRKSRATRLLSYLKYAVLAVFVIAVGLACVFCYRGFCRFLCPLGAIYSLFNRFCLVGVRVDTEKCSGCGSCVRSCGMDVKRVGDRECIHCAGCMDVCPEKAITLKAGNVSLKAPEGSFGADERKKRKNAGRAAWGIALALLCFALLWFNFLSPA